MLQHPQKRNGIEPTLLRKPVMQFQVLETTLKTLKPQQSGVQGLPKRQKVAKKPEAGLSGAMHLAAQSQHPAGVMV